MTEWERPLGVGFALWAGVVERDCGTALSEIMVPKPESGLDLDEMRSGDPSVPSLVRGARSGRSEQRAGDAVVVCGTVVRGESAIQAVRSCPVRSCGVVRACESSVWAGRDVRSVSCGSRQEWVGAPGRQGAMSGEGGDHDHGIYVTLLTTMACQWPAPCLETLWRAARQRVFDGPASQPSHGQPGGTPRRQPSCSQGGHEARLARPALEQAWPAWPMIELR